MTLPIKKWKPLPVGIIKEERIRCCAFCGYSTIYYDVEMEKFVCSKECWESIIKGKKI
jgi:hypothetical protein